MGRYFEEFDVGETFETASRRIERKTILDFATLTGDDNPLHIDPAAVPDSPFVDVIAHGLLVESLVVGLIVQLGLFSGTTIALLEANCRFKKAAMPGDEIRARLTIADKRETSNPERGVLVRHVQALNQRDEVVLEAEFVSLLRRRGTPE
jgi:acyl dehydratase